MAGALPVAATINASPARRNRLVCGLVVMAGAMNVGAPRRIVGPAEWRCTDSGRINGDADWLIETSTGAGSIYFAADQDALLLPRH
jgi:hypothetical protein